MEDAGSASPLGDLGRLLRGRILRYGGRGSRRGPRRSNAGQDRNFERAPLGSGLASKKRPHFGARGLELGDARGGRGGTLLVLHVLEGRLRGAGGVEGLLRLGEDAGRGRGEEGEGERETLARLPRPRSPRRRSAPAGRSFASRCASDELDEHEQRVGRSPGRRPSARAPRGRPRPPPRACPRRAGGAPARAAPRRCTTVPRRLRRRLSALDVRPRLVDLPQGGERPTRGARAPRAAPSARDGPERLVPRRRTPGAARSPPRTRGGRRGTGPRRTAARDAQRVAGLARMRRRRR